MNNEDQDIQDAMNHLTNTEPSEKLMRNLRVMANHVQPRKAHWWSSKLVMAGAATAGVAVVVLTMTPTRATAKTFDMLVSAAQQVNAFEFTIDSKENSKPESLTISGADGRVYMRTQEGTFMQLEGGALQIYDPKENTVTKFSLGGMVNAEEIAKEVQSGIAEGLKQMDLKKMLAEYKAKYGADRIKISGISRDGGRDVYYVELESPSEPDRVNLKVDAASDLPELIEVEHRGSTGTWQNSVRIRMRYGASVDVNHLKSTFPKNAKVVDINLDSLVGKAMEGIGDAFKEAGSEIKKRNPK